MTLYYFYLHIIYEKHTQVVYGVVQIHTSQILKTKNKIKVYDTTWYDTINITQCESIHIFNAYWQAYRLLGCVRLQTGSYKQQRFLSS